MSICYYFHPDGYITAGRQVMGRHVAGESFLKAALKYGTDSELWIQVEKNKHISIFESIAKSFGRNQNVNSITRSTLGQLRKPGCLFLPGPGVGEWARHRSRFGDASWSICGITHTTASTRAMDAIADLLTAPVHPWDALICTSRAVHNNVSRILEAEAEYLKRRLGVSKITLPKLPIIPLGVHADDFKRNKSVDLKARKELNISQDEVVILFVGRLAFHGKAHPLVMYQALEQAVSATGKKIVLIECGWHANEKIQKSFERAAATACPSVRCLHLDGRNPEKLALGWSSADIFCSLSDNIQETFGITPIEAMAAGLPVVVSDWDGYRDTVRDGIDGFRIPTYMPPPGYGEEIASRHALEIDSYDMYCAHTSSVIAVDLAATTKAFIKLISSSNLRNKMGSQGRQRVLDVYDWKVIIPTYEQLWAELTSLRKASADCSHQPTVQASRLDPFYGFASYPSKKVRIQSWVQLSTPNSDIVIQRLHKLVELEMVNYILDRMASMSQLESVLRNLNSSSKSIETLIHDIEDDDRGKEKLFLSIIWMIKLGLLEIDQKASAYSAKQFGLTL